MAECPERIASQVKQNGIRKALVSSRMPMEEDLLDGIERQRNKLQLELHGVEETYQKQRDKVAEGKELLQNLDKKEELFRETIKDLNVLIEREKGLPKQGLTRFEVAEQKLMSELVEPCRKVMREYAKGGKLTTSVTAIRKWADK